MSVSKMKNVCLVGLCGFLSFLLTPQGGDVMFSYTLTFLLYLVAKNPSVQQKIYQELEEIAPNSNHITSNDLSRMAYTKGCILESYRKIPVAFALGRLLEEDMDLSGYRVQAGTYVTCHTMAACMNEENFSRAGEYLPERWIEGNPMFKQSQSASTCIFAPFGIGRRMCPGKRFMQQAILVTLAKLIREFHIEFDGEMDIQFEFILTPKSPVKFRLRNRC